jgi:hypothetical protein
MATSVDAQAVEALTLRPVGWMSRGQPPSPREKAASGVKISIAQRNIQLAGAAVCPD